MLPRPWSRCRLATSQSPGGEGAKAVCRRLPGRRCPPGFDYYVASCGPRPGLQWRALSPPTPTFLGPPPRRSLCPADFRPQPRRAGFLAPGRGLQAQVARGGAGLGAGLASWTGLGDVGVVCCRGRGHPGGSGPSGRAQPGGRQRPRCAPAARGLAAAGGDVRLPGPQRPPGAARRSRL